MCIQLMCACAGDGIKLMLSVPAVFQLPNNMASNNCDKKQSSDKNKMRVCIITNINNNNLLKTKAIDGTMVSHKIYRPQKCD